MLNARKIERINIYFFCFKFKTPQRRKDHEWKKCSSFILWRLSRSRLSVVNINGAQTLRLLENVLPSSLPQTWWSNFCQIKKQCSQAKRQKTSETKQEKSRKFESNYRKWAINPAWKESFSWGDSRKYRYLYLPRTAFRISEGEGVHDYGILRAWGFLRLEIRRHGGISQVGLLK